MMAAALDQPMLESVSGPPAPDGASITPPQSANGKKEVPDGVPSELSDLELDPNAATAPEVPSVEMEEEKEIEPDHYYGGGKIPVFKPTMDQFRDFQYFINKVEKYGMKSGIIKVIPPKEWSDSLPPLDEAVKKIRVKNPIMQEFHGSHGTYTQANIERQRSYNLPQWKALCEESSHQPPARRGERRRNQERVTRTPAAPRPQNTRSDSQKRGPGRPPKRSNQVKVKEEPPAEESLDKVKLEGPPTPVSPESNPVEAKTEELSDGESLPAPKPKGRQPKSVSARRKNNKGDMADTIDEEAFKDFDYRIHDHEEYTQERCEELETAYWKSLMFNNPMYGADMPGSLFDDNTTSWNVAKLPNLLDVLGQKVPGVNTAYLYLGMWKATFAWHLEDVDLYSINYIHFGAPKQWYSISQEDAPRFEQAMKSIWTSDAKNCDQFLRHKTYLVSPSLLKSQYGITVNRLVHYEGEFVITYPYGYHSGYNIGYNCAESVNFATEKWLEYGRVAKKCHCEADSVWIDVDEIERKLRGESTPEYYGEYESDLDEMEGASDLLTPPRSVPEKSTRGRKRKHDGDTTRAKRMRVMDVPRKIPCVLCPNNLDYEDLLPTEDGKHHAHRRCALYTEETSILRDESGKEVVCDVDKIPKARMGLKCLFCREVRGACFQCNFGKCTRSYHATCALLAGVQVEHGQVAVIADDGNQYSVPSVDLKCKYHRQKKPTWMTSTESPVQDRKLIETARRLVMGDLVQFQADREINGAVVLDNRPAERTMLVKVLPRGDVIELPYRWMLVVRRSNFSPLAPGTKPLPAHLARKPDARKEVESTVPVAGNPFGDEGSPYQWAEFETVDNAIQAPPPSAPVDLHKSEQIWHYLGQSSTECRAQYTHNPSVRVHNPRANFLDSVKSLGAVMARLPSSTYPHHLQHRHRPLYGPAAGAAPPRHYYLSPAAAAVTARGGSAANVTATAAAAASRPSLLQRPPLAPPSRASSSAAAAAAAASAAAAPSAVASAMPSAYRTLPSQSARHAPYPQFAKSLHSSAHLPSQQQHSSQQQQTAPANHHHHHLPANTFANVRELIARRRLAQITDHANVFAGYTIVGPELVVETLLGPMGSVPPPNGLEKLELAMAQQRVQPRAPDGTVLPLQPLNMRSEEVTRLLQMLRFSLVSHRDRLDVLQKKESESTKLEPAASRGNGTAASTLPRKYAYLEQQREQSPTVYQSPYDMPSGFSEYAQKTFGLTPCPPELPKPSLANDYFAGLSPEDQEKILKTCGSFVQRAIERSASHSRQSSASNLRLASALAQQTENPTIDITTVEDLPLSGLDFPLHADSPSSSFSRSHLRFQSPNDFTSHGPETQHDHHDLFGDQQANTRFWQHGPWVAGDGNTPNEETRPFFGPHERLKHDYASSDISLGKGPGSLHSVDMAGFGLDGTDDICAVLSP